MVTEEQKLAKNKQRREKTKADRANGIPPIKQVRNQSKRKKQDRRDRDQKVTEKNKIEKEIPRWMMKLKIPI